MANVYVGFHDQRNSSRVLKPPGGGTSDIFGTDAPINKKNGIELVTSTNEKNDVNNITAPISKAKDQLANEDNTKNGNCEEKVDQSEKTNNLSSSDEEPKIENLNISDENKENPIVTSTIEENKCESKCEIKASATTESISSIIRQQDKQKTEPEPEKRTGNRVPPGGYSSGLW